MFRDTEAWESLAGEIIPRILRRKAPSDLIRVWSASCLSGQEPFSVRDAPRRDARRHTLALHRYDRGIGRQRAADAVELPGENARAQEAPPAPRMLIIDDNQDAAELLAIALRERGHLVDVATDGSTGLAAASANDIEVALVDLGLPDMDAYEVCRQLRRTVKGVRVVAITGDGDQHARGAADAAGFLLKPVSPETVIRAMRALPSGEVAIDPG